MALPTISIIVPCWRGDAVLPAVAAEWMQTGVVREIIVAAPLASEDQPDIRQVHCAHAGRGFQMNEGARVATGDILLFQHADTELRSEHLQSLAASGAMGGAFSRRFDERHPHLRWLEPWEALRCRLFGPLFGDQSIFVRREIFEALGGFADMPLMEDVDFTCRLRRHGKLAILNPPIASSARKHLQKGRWRTTAANALFLLLYLTGVSPARLHRWYYGSSTS